MKRILIALLIVPALLWAADQTITMKVSGNCGSCKKRIVKAANSVDGVSDASWDKTTKIFTATFDDTKATADSIRKQILKAGYDVEGDTADQAAYQNLPDCCKYKDRTHD